MALATAKSTVTLRDLTQKFDLRLRKSTPFYPTICQTVPSDGYDEKYGWLGAFPGVREWLGDRIFEQLRAANFTLVNKHWENSLLIPKNDIKDDRLRFYIEAMEKLADEAAYHPDQLVVDLITGGDGTVCWDGQYFHDTDHSWGDSGSQSNDLTFDATSHTAVTPLEFKNAYHLARKAMLAFKNDRGKRLLSRPVAKALDNLQLLVPLELEQIAHEAMKGSIISQSSSIVLDQPDIVCVPDLAGTEFILNYLGEPLKPFIFQAREPISRDMKGMDDMEFKDAKFMTEARYNATYGPWWLSVLTTFN